MKDISKIIREAAIGARIETDTEPEPQLPGEISWPVRLAVNKGLEGAIACTTKVGYVDGAKGWLVYRGYNCFDLAEKSTFEETTFLLIHGRLPTKVELDAFTARLRHYRRLPPQVADVLRAIPIARTHPMAALRTAISALGTLDESADQATVGAETEVAVKLIAQMATITAMIGRLRAGAEPVDPHPGLSHAGDFLYMLTGVRPDATDERLMDISLILHADHGMNASTFTSMVTNSSLSDMYSTVVAGICSLKGPLQGGANEQVLDMLDEIGGPEQVEAWFRKAIAEHRKIMGIGHRVYKTLDPRARILEPLAGLMAERRPEIRRTYETAIQLEQVVAATISQDRKLFPNVDFYSGIVYRGLGIDTAMFTPIFAVSRVAGWAARVLEYQADNRIFRPRAAYQGPLTADYVPFEARGSGHVASRAEDRVRGTRRVASRAEDRVRSTRPVASRAEDPIPILVVDDQADSRELVRDLLSEGGHTCLLAADGAEALEIIRRRPIRVVVTDVHMPGIDGMELLDHLRIESPDIPVILFTGDCRLPLGIRALARGAFYFLEKPIRGEEILALVEKAMNATRPGEVAGV